VDSHTNLDFRKCLAKLPREARRTIYDYYKRWKDDPFGTSFYFKPIVRDNSIWSVRAGDHYRAFGVRSGEDITWFWVGTHEEANGLIKKVGKKNTESIQSKR